MIAILDTGIGNLKSVYNAVYTLGYDPEFITGDDIERLFNEELDALCTHLIIPGVGAWEHAMEVERLGSLRDSVHRFADSGRPVLGICLGMQLLASRGEEGKSEGSTEGLGLIPGTVTRLLVDEQKLPLPHVGWNSVNRQRPHPILEGVESGIDCYFVHSYHFVCDAEEDLVATSDYGVPFTCIVGRGNVVGCQFHPEKSQANGLKMLENFCDWDGQC
ncbi:MAG: imidazole glycerol phosphate synthase subunit HisH [Rhodospirillaceae bacterium]|jgi:glutamine amidotransferase|nr:imidazole glycerol phosphate synthase subunit HisH [Rhodospirillaceae bacterium]|tara:strand:+ start:168 stop:821 length:654 start_codon:yes stop_codon:yes gene_type:complete